ncbi:hypothetical protein ACEPPN_015423 [Leptodophora sp. 'Broadleaf-Isolate-01']
MADIATSLSDGSTSKDGLASLSQLRNMVSTPQKSPEKSKLVEHTIATEYGPKCKYLLEKYTSGN